MYFQTTVFSDNLVVCVFNFRKFKRAVGLGKSMYHETKCIAEKTEHELSAKCAVLRYIFGQKFVKGCYNFPYNLIKMASIKRSVFNSDTSLYLTTSMLVLPGE